jgi:hypothetical protein
VPRGKFIVMNAYIENPDHKCPNVISQAPRKNKNMINPKTAEEEKD